MKKFILFLFFAGMFAFSNTVQAEGALCDLFRLTGYCGDVPAAGCPTITDDNQCDHCTSEFQYFVLQVWNTDTEQWEYACNVTNPTAWAFGFDNDGNLIDPNGGTWFDPANFSHVIVNYWSAEEGGIVECPPLYPPECEDAECEKEEPDFSVSGKMTSCTYDPIDDVSYCTYNYCVDNLDDCPGALSLWLLYDSAGNVVNASTTGCFDFFITDGSLYVVELQTYIPGTTCLWISYTETIGCQPCNTECPPWREIELRGIETDLDCTFKCEEGFPIYAYSQAFFDIHFYYPFSGTWEVTVTAPGQAPIVLTNPTSPFQYTMECEVYTAEPFCQSNANFELRYYDEDGCLTGYRLVTLEADHESCYLQECPERRLVQPIPNNFVYPNPISASQQPRLNLQSLEAISSTDQTSTVELFNATGQVIRSLVANGQSNASFDLQGTSPGIYFLRIKNEKEILHTEKVVILE